MARDIGEGTAVAWLPGDHPGATNGAGYYEVLQDNEINQQLDENGDSVEVNHGNTEVRYGEKLAWVKNTPDPEGQPNAENNEGRFVYASSLGEESSSNNGDPNAVQGSPAEATGGEA